MTRLGYTVTFLVGASFAVAACSGSIDDGPQEEPPQGGTAGSPEDTFDHENDSVSIWTLIDRLVKEGPPSFTSRMHGCVKVRYATLGNVLRGLGVRDLDVATPPAGSAARLYRAANNSIGTPNYPNRLRENTSLTTSGASSLFDIFAAGADEITTAMPNILRCQVNGVGPTMFDATGTKCNAAAITCLIGVPAQPAHVALCEQSIANATTPAIGRRIAVAALLAAAYTCE